LGRIYPKAAADVKRNFKTGNQLKRGNFEVEHTRFNPKIGLLLERLQGRHASWHRLKLSLSRHIQILSLNRDVAAQRGNAA